VAIGLALDSRYSVQVGFLKEGEDVRICALLEKLGFRLWHPLLEKSDDEGNLIVLSGLREFREHLGGELTITLLRDIGVGEEVHEMHEAEIRKAVAWLKHRLERR
jgi:3-dehydroquinate synthase